MAAPPVAPGPPEDHVRSIALDIVLAVVTCGLYNIYVQAKQMAAVNEMIREEKYTFVPWLLLTLVTCGLYHIYHEYRKSTDIAAVIGAEASSLPVLSIILSIFGLSIVSDAIQQTHINRHYGSKAL